MRPTDHGQCLPHAISLCQGVSQRAGLCVAGDENNVQRVGKQTNGVLLTVVGGVPNLMAQLSAPHRDGLRNDAGMILLEKSAVNTVRPALGC